MRHAILWRLLLVGIVFSAFVVTGGIVMAGTDLSVTKTDALFNDADGDGVPSPGDTLRYEIIVTNETTASAEDVVFSDTPDGNTTLVVGSVQTTQGTITSGNDGTPPVTVDIGTIPGLGVVVIHFQVTINDPFPAGISQVANQAVVSGSNFPEEPSDDPDDPGAGDPTITSVTAPLPVGGHLSVVDREAVLRANSGRLILPLAALIIVVGVIALVVIRRRRMV